MADVLPYARSRIDQLERHLEPGEVLLWHGRPDPRRWVRRRLWGWTGVFTLGAASMLTYVEKPTFLGRLCAAGCVLLLHLLVALPLLAYCERRTARRTKYLVTNRRVVFIQPGLWRERVGAMELGRITDVQRREHEDGFGEVTFGLAGRPRRGRARWLRRRFGFHGIPDAQHVEGLLRRLAAEVQQAQTVEAPAP